MGWLKSWGIKLLIALLALWVAGFYATIWHSQRYPTQATVYLPGQPKAEGLLSLAWNGNWVLRNEDGELRFKDEDGYIISVKGVKNGEKQTIEAVEWFNKLPYLLFTLMASVVCYQFVKNTTKEGVSSQKVLPSALLIYVGMMIFLVFMWRFMKQVI